MSGCAPVIAAQPSSSTPEFPIAVSASTSTLTLTPIYTPMPTPTATPIPHPIHAVRIDYGDYTKSRNMVDALEANMRQGGVNMVALSAGRADWTYFKWEGHPEAWSSDVQNTGIDFLAEDVARFKAWADHISVVVDVYASRYVAAHPESAAISADGNPSPYLVSTMQLVEGQLGSDLLQMLDYIAANYPVDSIALTELAYHVDGYGNDDQAAYMAHTGLSDWPRRANGQVDFEHPSVGEWRSYEIGRFLEKAAAIAHGHGKQLFMDVDVSWGNLSNEASEYGQNYAVMLQHADRIIVWDYFSLSGYNPEYTGDIAGYLEKYGPDRVILSVGLWGKNGSIVSPDQLRLAMQAALGSPIPHLWITPSLYLSDQHWQVMKELWSH